MTPKKTCKSCGEAKELPDFYKKRSGALGVTGSCRDCVTHKNGEAYRKNSKARKLKMREYRQKNLTTLREYDRDRYSRDPQNRLSHVHAWRADPSNRAKGRALERAWRIRNGERKNALVAARRSRTKTATPSWLTPAQRNEIVRIYEHCPAGFHVDHIVPLKGEVVSGLHVPWNLQYLPAEENLRKGARHE